MADNTTIISVTTPAPSFFHDGGDITLGILHLTFGILAIVGNAIVFFSYLKYAAVRSSACMFVQLAVAGVIVGYTSIYSGVYLVKGRPIPEEVISNTTNPLYHYGLSVGHTWWFGFTCTIMLVTTLSVVRAWSIARPFRYKANSSRIQTFVLSAGCWAFGALWIGVRYLVKCRWVLQEWFSYAHVSCNQDSEIVRAIVFPLDVIPQLCAAIITTTSNAYVVYELARSFRHPPASQQTRETFSKTTLLIVAMTTLFLFCYSPTVIFFFLNSISYISKGKIDVMATLDVTAFIYIFAVIYLCPCIYPALSPLLQFCGINRNRESPSLRKNTARTMLYSKKSSRTVMDNPKRLNLRSLTFESLQSPKQQTRTSPF